MTKFSKAMPMTQKAEIESLSLFSEVAKPYLAEITLRSGFTQRPTWKGLSRYWKYAKPDVVEYSAVSFSTHFAVFCFFVASGQGGIIAVWNTLRRRWEQVSEGNFVACAMILEEWNVVVSLHYISAWGISAHHSIYARLLDRTRDGFAVVSSVVKAVGSHGGIDPKRIKIQKAAFGTFLKNEDGPLGIFLLEDGLSLLAHDAGSRLEFSLKDIRRALSKSSKKPGEGFPLNDKIRRHRSSL